IFYRSIIGMGVCGVKEWRNGWRLRPTVPVAMEPARGRVILVRTALADGSWAFAQGPLSFEEAGMALTEETLQRIGWVGLGGFLGANARYWLGGWVAERWGTDFPWATFVINISGSFILGLFMTLITERYAFPHAPTLRLVVAIGFVGAYTTFSTF